MFFAVVIVSTRQCQAKAVGGAKIKRRSVEVIPRCSRPRQCVIQVPLLLLLAAAYVSSFLDQLALIIILCSLLFFIYITFYFFYYRCEQPIVEKMIQVFVNSTAYTVDPAVSVESFKAQIENKEFIPASQIRLMAGGKVLEGGSLEAYSLEDEDEIALSMEVPAGMRAKWRKKRMRRLRRKRRKMRQRAR